MPLDAQDKLRAEAIEEMLMAATAYAEPKARERLIQSGGQMARAILEVVPPDSPWRNRILERLEDTIQLIAAATLPKAAA